MITIKPIGITNEVEIIGARISAKARIQYQTRSKLMTLSFNLKIALMKFRTKNSTAINDKYKSIMDHFMSMENKEYRILSSSNKIEKIAPISKRE